MLTINLRSTVYIWLQTASNAWDADYYIATDVLVCLSVCYLVLLGFGVQNSWTEWRCVCGEDLGGQRSIVLDRGPNPTWWRGGEVHPMQPFPDYFCVLFILQVARNMTGVNLQTSRHMWWHMDMGWQLPLLQCQVMCLHLSGNASPRYCNNSCRLLYNVWFDCIARCFLLRKSSQWTLYSCSSDCAVVHTVNIAT